MELYSEEGSHLAFIFSEDTLLDFKDKLVIELGIYQHQNFEESQIYDTVLKKEVLNITKRKSKQKIYKNALSNNLIKKLTSILKSSLKGIKHIKVFKDVTLLVYEEGDYFLKHRDFVRVMSRDRVCAHLLLYLEEAEKGGETVLYLDEENNSVTTTSDVIFDKTIVHESLPVEKGTKKLLLLNIEFTKNKTVDCVCSIDYLGKKLPLYDCEANYSLCYCDINFVKPNEDISYHFGILTNKTGKCLEVHFGGRPSVGERKKTVYSSFDDYCNLFTFYTNLDSLYSEKNIAWSKIDPNKDDFLPDDATLFSSLIKTANAERKYFLELKGFCNCEDGEYVYCVMSKYYFNYFNKHELCSILTEKISSAPSNWNMLPFDVQMHILHKLTYSDLYTMVTRSN